MAWLFGTLGFVGFGFLVFLGQYLIGRTGAISASIMMAFMPMLGLLSVWVLKKIRPKITTFIFILISLFGVILVVTNGNIEVLLQSKSSLIANLLLVGGALCWALYTIGASYFPDWSPLRYTALTTLLGEISLIVITAILIIINAIPMPDLPSVISNISHLLYMALVAGVIGVLAWNVGNSIIASTNGILFMPIVPVSTFIISAFNGVVPTQTQIIGIIIVIIGLVLHNINQRRMTKIRKKQ